MTIQQQIDDLKRQMHWATMGSETLGEIRHIEAGYLAKIDALKKLQSGQPAK